MTSITTFVVSRITRYYIIFISFCLLLSSVFVSFCKFFTFVNKSCVVSHTFFPLGEVLVIVYWECLAKDLAISLFLVFHLTTYLIVEISNTKQLCPETFACWNASGSKCGMRTWCFFSWSEMPWFSLCLMVFHHMYEHKSRDDLCY